MKSRALKAEIGKFKDPVASRVSWKPIIKKGISFRTHNVSILKNKIKFEVGIISYLYFLILLLLGSVMILIALLGVIDGAHIMSIVFFLMLGVPFFLYAIYHLLFSLSASVFDLENGVFYKSGLNLKRYSSQYSIKYPLDLSKIYAIQVIEEYVHISSEERRSYYSYEVNLVLESAIRINIIDHAEKEEIIKNSLTISKALDIPIWSNRPYLKPNSKK